jgi:DNA-binding XRE family transcriptional regulator
MDVAHACQVPPCAPGSGPDGPRPGDSAARRRYGDLSEAAEIILAMAARSEEHAALGEAIRESRTRAEISQEALARRSGLHRTYIGGIERGERNVSFANLIRISDALDERPAKLLERYEKLLRCAT